MKRKNGLYILLVGVIVALLAGSLMSPKKSSSSKPVVTMGVVLPLSGPSAGWGESVKAGFEQSYQELDPALRAQIKLVYEDNQFSGAKSISATQKLILEDKVQLLYVMPSSAKNAVAPTVEAKKVPTLALSFDPTGMESKKYTMNFYTPIRTYVKTICQESRQRGYKNIFLTTVNNDGGAIFAKELLSQCGELVVNKDYDKYTPGDSDFRTSVLKIGEQKPDAVMMFLIGGQIGSFARDVRQTGYKGDLIGNDVSEDQNELKISQGGFEGMWYVAPANYTSAYQAMFEKNYLGLSVLNSTVGYDALKVVAAGIKEGHTDSASLNTYLHGVKNFKGSIGNYGATNQNDFSMPAIVKEVKNGKFVNK